MAGARKVAVTKYQFWHARSPRERILEIHYKVRLLQQKEGFWVAHSVAFWPNFVRFGQN